MFNRAWKLLIFIQIRQQYLFISLLRAETTPLNTKTTTSTAMFNYFHQYLPTAANFSNESATLLKSSDPVPDPKISSWRTRRFLHLMIRDPPPCEDPLDRRSMQSTLRWRIWNRDYSLESRSKHKTVKLWSELIGRIQSDRTIRIVIIFIERI